MADTPELDAEVKLRRWSEEFLAIQLKRGVDKRTANAAAIVVYEMMCRAYQLGARGGNDHAE